MFRGFLLSCLAYVFECAGQDREAGSRDAPILPPAPPGQPAISPDLLSRVTVLLHHSCIPSSGMDLTPTFLSLFLSDSFTLSSLRPSSSPQLPHPFSSRSPVLVRSSSPTSPRPTDRPTDAPTADAMPRAATPAQSSRDDRRASSRAPSSYTTINSDKKQNFLVKLLS